MYWALIGVRVVLLVWLAQPVFSRAKRPKVGHFHLDQKSCRLNGMCG